MENELIRVLLVDDDEDDYIIIRDLLTEIKYTKLDLDWVATYAAAVEAIKRNSHDVYLLDYRLGEHNGLELLRQALRHGCRAPMILLTGQGDQQVDVEAMQAGAADYLIKGQIEAPLLERSIRYALQHSRTLETLRESEDRFRRLVELSPEMIGVFSQERLVYVNPAGMKLLGVVASEEVVGQSLVDWVHPDSLDIVVEQIMQVQDRERAIHPIEAKLMRLDGQAIEVEMRATSITFDGKSAVQIVVTDITERKRNEAKIHSRNRELELLNRLIVTSTANLEPESVLETACRELARALNLPHAVVGLLNEDKTEMVIVAEYLAGGQPSALKEALPVAGNPSFQYLFTHKAPLAVGDVRSDPRFAQLQGMLRQRGLFSLLLLPLVVEDELVGNLELGTTEPRQFSTEEVNLAWSVADQTAGALARARLIQTQRRLSTAIEQAAECIIITDAGGTILYVNPAFEGITGYKRVEVLSQNLRFLYNGQQDPAYFDELWATVRAGQVWHGRFTDKKQDSTLYTLEATITPVRGRHGVIVNYVQVCRDVTRELQLEEQYHQAQKMEAIGRLTGGIAHDFNNLLTAINGFAELMQHQLPPDSSFQDTVGKILYSGQRAANLVRQLLIFSRKQAIEPQILDLNTVVADMNTMLRRIIGEDIELNTVLASDLWPVKADPAQIEQVIVNLAVNARDAMPDGGHLVIETTNVRIEDDCADCCLEKGEAGEFILLTASDDGIGMTDEVKARIFEPFFTTKEAGKGTGLGLATVFGIIKQNGGEIRVISQEGHGTCFKIYLPRAEEVSPSLTCSEVSTELPSGFETILVAEDDGAVRELTKLVLHDLGYTILEAPDGREALQLVAAYAGAVHLLLTDVIMPGMSGRALAEQLAQSQPTLKILFMSGYTHEAIAPHGVLDPGIAFLQKPFSPLALARKVRAVLDR